MGVLLHKLDRSVVIEASQETVFGFFTDSEKWARWWGAGSTIDPRPGGKVYVLHPGGIETAGEVLEIDPPTRIVFTYGYVNGTPIPAGGSRVTIRLEAAGSSTRLNLMHEFDDEAVRDHHVQGWRFQLSLFGNAVADLVHAGAAGLAAKWFEAWAITDEQERRSAFEAIVSNEISFRDRYSMLHGLDDLLPHVSASQKFMPGLSLKMQGEIRHCQGKVLAEWCAVNAEGKELMRGTNLFEFNSAGKIVSATGFAAPAAP